MPGLIMAGGQKSAWTPSLLTDLFFYDDNTRTAAWDSTVTTEDLAELTVMTWVNPSSVSGFKGAIVGRGDSGSEHIRLDQNSDQIRFIEAGANFGSYNAAVSASTWTHLAWRFYGAGAGNSTRMRFWRNGTEVTASYTGTIPSALTSRSGKSWYVGRMTDGSSGYSAFGSIAQTIVCGSALSDADIVAAYNYTSSRK